MNAATATGLPAGTHNVLVTDSFGCNQSIIVEITQPTALSATTNTSNVSCFGGNDGSITVDVSGGTPAYQFSWNTNPGQNGQTAQNLQAGLYEVLITDANGCQLTVSDSVTQPYLPVTLNVSATAVSCYGGNDGQIEVLATGGNAPYDYSWSNGDTTSVNSGLSSGFYSLTVTDSEGCNSSKSNIFVMQPLPLLVGYEKEHIRCYGEDNGKISITVLGGNAPYSYTWSNGISASSIQDDLSPGYYNLTITDENGCEKYIDSIEIIEPLEIQIALLSGDESCPGEFNGWVAATATGGSMPYLYQWSNGFMGKNINGLSAGNYNLTVRDINNCKAKSSIIVEEGQLPDPLNLTDYASCYGDSLTIVLPEEFEYNWSSTAYISCDTCHNPIIYSSETSIFHVTASIPNTNQCYIEDSLNYQILPFPEVQLPADTAICKGNGIEININSTDSILWLSGNGIPCIDCPSNFIYPEISSEYHIAVYNEYGCINYGTLNIDVFPEPEFIIDPDTTICSGQHINLNGNIVSDNTTLTWLSDDGSLYLDSEQISVNPHQTTTYYAYAVNQYGCSLSNETTVYVVENQSTTFVDSIAICKGQEVQLESHIPELDENSTFTWSPEWMFENANELNPVVSPQHDITFQLSTDGEICENFVQYVHIVVEEGPEVKISYELTDITLNTYQLLSSAIGNELEYYWSPDEYLDCSDCPNPLILENGSSFFELTVIDNNGCEATDSIFLQITDYCLEDIFIPNTFTPDGNEINDILYVRSRKLESIDFFRIFNRWGQLVFETNDINSGWDGRFNGVILNSDVFAYHLQARCFSGVTVTKYGNVTLLR
ncbi:MAG: hypothetical protein EA412_06585 [Chitinophagaceae bacterium]|nr:MAG: hypothetical protein EA412_06585 [Chitinophagaceae bacterium]